MIYFELDKEEEKILKDFDKGVFKSVKNNKKEIVRYQSYTEGTLNKTKNINIRLSEKDLSKIKSKAIEKGIPYQTMLSSLIHQYISTSVSNARHRKNDKVEN